MSSRSASRSRLGNGDTATWRCALIHSLSARSESLGLGEDEAASLGADGATRIRTFRLLVVLAQELRTLMDHRLRPDGLTTQQAALITIVEALGTPSLSAAASALGTTHQNVKQLVAALERKGFLRIVPDRVDGEAARRHESLHHLARPRSLLRPQDDFQSKLALSARKQLHSIME